MDILNNIQHVLNSFYIPQISILDICEIGIIVWLAYELLMSLRNTRAIIVLEGVLGLFLVYYFTYLLNFQVIMTIFQWVLLIILFALIVVFQKEIRKLLEKIGVNVNKKHNFKDFFKKNNSELKRFSDETLNAIADSCYDMGKVKTGALIVIEGKIPLSEYSESGLKLDSVITSALIKNVFEKNTPLHDGAMIIKDNKIDSATCYLPLSQSQKINKSLGTRHRAAIGISEITDCLVIVVSEETGHVSYVENGTIKHGVPKEQLISKLTSFQLKDEKKKEKNLKYYLSRAKKNPQLKILSLLFGLLLWLGIMNLINPITTTKIENIPITIINEDVLESTGKTINMSEDKKVSVKITDVRSNTDKIKAEDIKVTGDLSKLSYVYSIPLSAISEKYPNAKIEIIGDDNLKIDLEDKIDKEFPIQIKRKNENKNDWYIESIFEDDDKIVVSSAKSIANTLNSVIIELDCSQLDSTIQKVELKPVVFDKNGNIVNEKYYTLNTDLISLELSYLPKKVVPIKINIPDKYLNTIENVVSTPNEIIITGTTNSLNNVNEINITTDLTIPANNINGEYEKIIDIEEYLPKGIYLTTEETKITLNIFPKILNQKVFVFENSEIELKNLSSNIIPVLTEENYSIVVTGKPEVLNKLQKDQLKPYMDLTDLAAGEYNLLIQINKIDGVSMLESITGNIVLKAKGD